MIEKLTLLKRAGITLLLSASCGSLLAGEYATEEFYGSSLSLTPTVAYDKASLRVSGDNTDASQVFENGDAISMSLSDLSDGMYYYQLNLSTAPADPSESMASDPSGKVQSGKFIVVQGVASELNDEIEEAQAQAEADANQALAAANASLEPNMDDK